ncbi:MAG TPA: hypothetical protein VIY55_12640 [Acetobacteraceae bacterium]|jgi:hypothetical protein
MPRLTQRQIDATDREMLARQARFRAAADLVTAALVRFAEVEAVALIGSVARPLWKEVPRFWRRDETWHECKDVDLAVWLSRLDRLRELNRARNVTANRTFEKLGMGVANHEVDIFILAPGTDRFLGRLCNFAQCPKGNRACEVPGCGAEAFLQQHENFVFWPSALNADRMVLLYRRGQGIVQRAADIPSTGS